MNEQNNNLNTVPMPQQTAQPVPNPAPAPSPVPTQVDSTVAEPQVANVNPSVGESNSQVPTQVTEAPKVEPVPVVNAAPSPTTSQVDSTTAEPQVANVNLGVGESNSQVPTQVTEVPKVEPVPVVNAVSSPTPQPVEQSVVPPTPAPVQTDIVAGPPINPIENNATVAPATVTPTLSPNQPQPMIQTPVANNNVGFVPNGTPLPKKKNNTLIIIIVVALIAILAILGIFVIVPMVKKSLTTPKMVYEVAIQDVAREINATIDDTFHDKMLVDVSFGVDSNMETISDFNGYKFGINTGIDSTKEALQAGLYMKNSTAEYSLYGYIKDGKKYSRYSTDDALNYLGELSEQETNELFAAFKEFMESQDTISQEDANYIVNKFSELLISSFDEEKFSREETTLKVNGKTVKALNNKYIIDNATAEKMVKHILDGLKSDDKIVKIFAKMAELTEDEIKEFLTYKEEDNSENIDDTTITLNLYTDTNLKNSIGFSLNDDKGEVKVHYYTIEDAFEIELYSKSVDEETNEDIETKINVNGFKKNNVTNVIINLKDKKVMSMAITENTDKKLALTYEIFGDENSTIKGSFKVNVDDNGKRNKTSYEFTLNAGDQKLTINLDILMDWTSEVANINTGSAVQVTEAEIQNKTTTLITQISQTPLGILLQTISGMNNNGLNDYYGDGYNSLDGNDDSIIITPDDSDNAFIVDDQDHIN